jgi:phenylalanyl-tRNA synthetase beta chain
MKYSYIWLKELSGTRKTPKQLAGLLTMRAFELEDSKAEGKETRLEFSILPNRAHDALSHIGLAREICACEGRKFHFPTSDVGKLSTSDVGRLRIEIKDKKLCPRYVGAIIENVKVGPSPKWMRERLLVCGVKPINNIVDITNYVMLETGQPLHAFDFDKIKSEFPISNLAYRQAGFQFPNKSQNTKSQIRIIVRRAKKGEKIKLLDEKVYELSESDLVITDSEKPIALAGVMGGLKSSVSKKTRTIILESANFNSASVRKTRISYNIVTESSYRFERQIDPNLAEMGAARAVELLEKYGGKNIKIVATADIYPKKIKSWQIRLDMSYVNSLLGEKIPVSGMKNILENLGLVVRASGKFLNCEIPTRRIDLKTQEDLVEEVGRIYGYENIREQPLVAEVEIPPQNAKRDFENKLRDILVGLGFSEVMNYSFYSADDIQKCNLKIKDHIEVANPLSLDQQYLRRNLITNLLKNISLNLKNYSQVKIFEIGKKFILEKGTPGEIDVIAGMLADSAEKHSPFLELKGKIDGLLTKLGYKDIEYRTQNTEHKFWHESRTTRIIFEGEKIGKIGEINPRVLKRYGIKQRIAAFGLKIPALLKVALPDKLYRPISKFPTVERDISMFVNKLTSYSELIAKIREAGGKLLKNIELFDIFKKDSQKSLALRLKIGSDAKTLTSAEIDAVMKKIILKLEKELKVKVRK